MIINFQRQRFFILLTWAVLLGRAGALLANDEDAPSKKRGGRPNILFIMSDDQ